MHSRNTAAQFALAALTLCAPIRTHAQAVVTLLFDDSKAPEPYTQVHFCLNADPATGEFSADWNAWKRFPMFDDGKHGDGAANDKVWGAEVRIKPRAGQLFEWALDDDTDPNNGWIGMFPSFTMESESPRTVRAHSMPVEAGLSVQEASEKLGVDVTKPAPPSRIGVTDRVLFVFKAPPETRRVFIAGSFNDWARNNSGRVTEKRSAMFPAPENVWYRTMELRGKPASFKYVVESNTGDFKWIADPLVLATNDEGNTLIDPENLPVAKPYTAATGGTTSAGADPVWKLYTSELHKEILAREGRILIYARVKENARVNAFEREFLFADRAKATLQGQTILFGDSSDATFIALMREIGLQRVPSLAWTDASGTWRTYVHKEKSSPLDAASFIEDFVRKPKP